LIKPLRHLLLKGLSILLASATVAAIIFINFQPDPLHYYRGSLLKVSLLETIPSPRIIVVGGSNVAWGIDSELLEKNLGMPVINNGVDAHLGIAPVVELKEYIRPGDIIIISLEYYNFTSDADFYGVPQNLADWVEISPPRIQYLQDPLRKVPTIFLMMLQRKINRQLNLYLYGSDLDEVRGIYSASNFNAHGDFIGHLEDKVQSQVGEDFRGYSVNQLDTAYIFLEQFNQFALSKGAVIYYEAQPNRQTNCELTGMKYLRKFYNTLKNRTTIPLLTNLKELCLPDDYFYDTPYHLNEKGRRIRTERLIDNLKLALGEP